MRYPESCNNIIDITKAPYFADNTGKKDCTEAIRQAIDDCVYGYITAVEETRQELMEMYKAQNENVYLGAEHGRLINGVVTVTFPKNPPLSKIIFFPSGTYLVSDTLSYTFDNLSTLQHPDYTCELCRNIHLLGENKENTIIRLKDNSEGFEKGSNKPVISFNKAYIENTETTNCAQMNTIEDITIDCGKGNDGAAGMIYAASNCGRIENVNIITESGSFGIIFDYSSEVCITNIKISGFDYGIKSGHTSPVIFENADFSGNKIAGALTKDGNMIFKKTEWGNLPAFEFIKGSVGRYFCYDKNISFTGDNTGNNIFYAETDTPDKSIPENHRSENFENWAYVDDFGAVGDGKTDSTNAIQRAMNSGKEVILFGSGKYVIERRIKVPATVKTIDFMYNSIAVGYSLLIGEMDSIFEICESSEDAVFFEHFLASDEKCNGFFRFCKQSAVRPAVFKDFLIPAALYFNTVPGSKVYFDNCFTHTNHYTQNCALPREGYTPVFCRMIPVELHGQTVYAKNLNIERADLDLLNDSSELIIDGYKTEGPGKMIKAINRGKTQLNLFNSAWWGNKISENELFEICDSPMILTGGNVFCYPDEEELSMALRVSKDNETYRKNINEIGKKLSGKDSLGRSWGILIENIII